MAGTTSGKPKIQVKRNTAKFQASLTKSSASSKPSTTTNNGKQQKKVLPALPAQTADDATIKPKRKVLNAPELEVNGTDLDKVWKKTREAMGKRPIHAEQQNRVDHILRVFDLNPEFGPCVGMSRLERWERAHELQLDPPSEIKDILLTRQGQEQGRYADNVLAQYHL